MAMAHLRAQFTAALSAIEPDTEDKTNAAEAHRLVRAALEADDRLAGYGIDTVLIGSYKRNVSIKRIKDVDVFSRLDVEAEDVEAQEILDHFYEVLDAEFGEDPNGDLRCVRQDRSVQVAFPDFDLHVDAVPARPRDEAWEIPEHGAGDEWVKTNPDQLTSLTSEMNAAHDGHYVKTVKLMRQTRRAQMGCGAKPGGLFVEILTYHAFERGLATGTDHLEYYASALRGAGSILDDFVRDGVEIPDPTLDDQSIKVRATPAQFEALRDALVDAADRADEALDMVDEGKAALIFRDLLGEDPDGIPIFPMPPGYDDDGSKNESSYTPGDRRVPGGNHQFG
jgi:hypothetical protein